MRSVNRSSAATLLLCLAFLMLAGMSSCKDSRPRDVLSEGKMENLLYDYHLAKAMAEGRSDSTVIYDRLYTQSVLRRYGLSQADFNRSMQWYTRHADVLYGIYTRISDRYEKFLQSGRNGSTRSGSSVYTSAGTKGDTANVWPAGSSFLLTPRGLSHTYSFNLKADTSFHPCDRFIWHFNAQFIYSQGRKEATAVLNVRYDNDSSTVVVQPIYSSGALDVSITAADLPIRGIDGFIYLNESWTEDVKLLYLSRFSLIRMHALPIANRVTTTSQEDSLKAVNAGKAALENDVQKHIIDSIQRTATQGQHQGPHFKEITGKEPMNNSLLQRSRTAGHKH